MKSSKSCRLFCVAIFSLSSLNLMAAGPFNDQPACDRSLPGDLLPPFSMTDDDGNLVPTIELTPEMIKQKQEAPKEPVGPGPNLQDAIGLARAALDYCQAHGFDTGVAVIDSAGEARAMLTADGSNGSHVFVAHRKAIAALAFALPSSQIHQAVRDNPELLSKVTPAMFVEGGGLPLFTRSGDLIGAIAVSGAAGEVIGRQDELCAAAALEQFGSDFR